MEVKDSRTIASRTAQTGTYVGSLGRKSDTATAADLSDITTTSLQAKLRRLLTNVHATPFCMDFWSNPQEEVSVPAVAADQALPDITVADIPTGATVVRAYVIFKFRAIENTNAAANKLSGAQEIQVRDDTPSTWIDAINFLDDMFGVAASTREGGDVFIGSIDVAATVDGNDTYNFQWDEALADLAALNFNDVQVGLRIWFTV